MYTIVDGNAIAHRTWHAAPIKDVRGEETVENLMGLYISSFCSQIASVVHRIDRFRPRFNKLIIVWDGTNSLQLRRELYPAYKHKRAEEREKKPERAIPYELINTTRDELTKVCSRYGIYDDQAEGDDLIALFCEILDGEDICIVTRDNDMWQLIRHNVKVLDPLTDILIHESDVKDKYGVTPEKLPIIKALMGDDSDNYPGIKGVGIKKAKELVDSYSKTLYPEVGTFLKIAKVPFEKLDTNKILEDLAKVNLDETPNWELIGERYGFGPSIRGRLSSVV